MPVKTCPKKTITHPVSFFPLKLRSTLPTSTRPISKPRVSRWVHCSINNITKKKLWQLIYIHVPRMHARIGVTIQASLHVPVDTTCLSNLPIYTKLGKSECCWSEMASSHPTPTDQTVLQALLSGCHPRWNTQHTTQLSSRGVVWYWLSSWCPYKKGRSLSCVLYDRLLTHISLLWIFTAQPHTSS